VPIIPNSVPRHQNRKAWKFLFRAFLFDPDDTCIKIEKDPSIRIVSPDPWKKGNYPENPIRIIKDLTG
jgi:hypothetical protein